MEFQNQIDIKGGFNLVRQHFIDDGDPNSSCRIFDAGKKTPFYFLCPNCKLKSTNINHLDLFDGSEFKIAENPNNLTGLTYDFKILMCSECSKLYYIGIEYSEPNNGRTVYSIKIIVEIEKNE